MVVSVIKVAQIDFWQLELSTRWLIMPASASWLQWHIQDPFPWWSNVSPGGTGWAGSGCSCGTWQALFSNAIGTQPAVPPAAATATCSQCSPLLRDFALPACPPIHPPTHHSASHQHYSQAGRQQGTVKDRPQIHPAPHKCPRKKGERGGGEVPPTRQPTHGHHLPPPQESSR